MLLLVPFYLNRVGALPPQGIGLLLAASPAGTALAAPVAGRLATRIPPRRLALIGAAAMAVGQLLIATAGAHLDVPVLAAAMGLQGCGVGLFQVAYFDIVTASIPRSDRGVAGSLVMMTRTIGTVTGATVLMLVFQTRARHGAQRRRRRRRRIPQRLRRHVPHHRRAAGDRRAARPHAWLGATITAA